MRIAAVLLLVACSGQLSAQLGIQCRVTTTYLLSVAAGPSTRTILPNTDVSNGYAIKLTGLGPQIPAIAEHSLQLEVAPQSHVYKLKSDAKGGFLYFGLQYETAAIHSGVLEFLYTSPTRTRVLLDVGYKGCFAGLPAGMSALTVQVVGYVTITDPVTCPTTPFVQRVPVWIDSTGLVVRVQQAAAGSGNSAGQSFGTSECSLSVLPDPSFPYAVTNYGAGCGASASLAPDLMQAGTAHFLFTTNYGGAPAVMVLGDTKANVVVTPTCFLLNNALAIVNMTAVGGYAREVYLPGLPTLGAHVYGQVFGAEGSRITASHGFDLVSN